MADPSQVRDIFDRAVQLAPAERAAFLQRACAGDAPLQRDVARLLSAFDNLGDLFEEDGADAAVAEAPPVPDVIGAYRIVRELGRGGAGTVYLAARHDEEFNREVAIKLLRPGMRSAELVRRFRHERQILASVEHPFIAKLLDGGSTLDGSPYLVMEYIDGSPIDTYCDANALSAAGRLELFCRVCEAVQFAHQNLVVHRDIKPGNILVTADGVPKLLDFGIAKLLDPSAFSLTIDVTLADARPMTPEFASPEQIRGEPVTTASDVYSLGVLLYRLLTGRRPYRRHTGALSDLARAICDEDPPRPSAIAGAALEDDETQAPTTDGSGERLRRQLRGDLDNIVLKAMRKEPHKRYASVEQFADDIQRYLSDLPVRASSDSVRYRASKFLRRHRGGVATAAAFVSLLAAASIVLAIQTAAIANERDRAEREAARAAAINDFLLRTLGAANPMSGTGRDVTLAAALSGAAATARHAFAREPETEAAVLNVVGMTFVELGRYDEAAPLLDRALALRTGALGTRDLSVAESLESKASLSRWQGRFDEAERDYRQALTIVRAARGDTRERTVQILHGLGLTFSQRGKEKEALTIYSEALEHARAGPIGERARAELLTSLGVTQRRLERYPDAEASYREALAIQRRLLGPEHAEVGTILNNLAVVLNATARYGDAEEVNREALKVRRAALGPGHPLVANSLVNLAVTLENKGDLPAAADLYDEAARVVRASLGPDHPRLAVVLRNWAVLLGNQDRVAEAVPLLREALRIRRAAFEEENREVADALAVLGVALRRTGSLQESEALTRQALALNRKLLGEDSEAVASSRKDLGVLLCGRGRLQPALDLLREAAAYYVRHPAIEPRWGAMARSEYGACLAKARRFPEAERELLDAHRYLSERAPMHRSVQETATRIADLYKAWGKPAQATRSARP